MEKPFRPQSPVLIIQHAPHEHAAALRRALESQGIPTLIVRIFEGAPLPSPSDISGMVSLGGPMGANDEIDYPWILDELRLIRRVVDLGIPYAGICLGGQMLARALGGKVLPNPHPEIGWFEVQLNTEGLADPLMSSAGGSPRFYQWHYDTFMPPAECVVLAQSPICARQAFRFGRHAYGFQFHPEADHQLVEEWLACEGVDEEILLARIAHHQECVQVPGEHRERALEGEMYSLSFVAAISQLFQKDPFGNVDPGIAARAEEFLRDRSPVVLKFYGPHGELTPIAGTVSRLIRIPKGDFLFLREENTLMWPVRLDHIDSLEKLSD